MTELLLPQQICSPCCRFAISTALAEVSVTSTTAFNSWEGEGSTQALNAGGLMCRRHLLPHPPGSHGACALPQTLKHGAFTPKDSPGRGQDCQELESH